MSTSTDDVSLIISGGWHAHYTLGACLSPGDPEETTCIAITTASEAQYEDSGSPGHILALVPIDREEVAQAVAGLLADAPRLKHAVEAIQGLCEGAHAGHPLSDAILTLLAPPVATAAEPVPAATQPIWTDAHSDAATAEGWDVFDTGEAVQVPRAGTPQGARDLQIQRLDDPGDDIAPYFDSDEDAWRHVVAKAREGSALHLLALQRISEQERERIRAECGDLPQPQAQPATVH